MSSVLAFDLESRREAGGSVAGVATATVSRNDDPEGLGPGQAEACPGASPISRPTGRAS